MPQTRNFTLPGGLLGESVPYSVIFPAGYTETGAQYPVLYLLHGLFGRFDNWLTNTEIIKYAAGLPFLIVCAEGGNYWYSDGGRPFESYFFEELFPEIESKFNTRPDKNSRAIAGLSMGGYGAFKFAFRRPEMFCFAAAMSGAFHAAEIFADDAWPELQDSIVEVFGSDLQSRRHNNLFQIVENFPAGRINELPFFYFDCGTGDSFLQLNTALAEIFRRRQISYEFQVLPGGHDWNYWDSQLKHILQLAGKFFDPPR